MFRRNETFDEVKSFDETNFQANDIRFYDYLPLCMRVLYNCVISDKSKFVISVRKQFSISNYYNRSINIRIRYVNVKFIYVNITKYVI